MRRTDCCDHSESILERVFLEENVPDDRVACLFRRGVALEVCADEYVAFEIPVFYSELVAGVERVAAHDNVVHAEPLAPSVLRVARFDFYRAHFVAFEFAVFNQNVAGEHQDSARPVVVEVRVAHDYVAGVESAVEDDVVAVRVFR